ncbi:ciliary microtubule inner protein 4 isoform X1 [Pelobates fuscus]|uniref:ciliary microtubule inner protein 4 isoform X1 n=1 Tax=Pelobates fuscus TaxID=191477 RepID=UPI002FE48A4D
MDVTHSEKMPNKSLPTNTLNSKSRYFHGSSLSTPKTSQICLEGPANVEKHSQVDLDSVNPCKRRASSTSIPLKEKTISRSSETTMKKQDSLVPANIRHKYGTSLVDQLISPEQVKQALTEANENISHSNGYHIPKPSLNSWLVDNIAYYELGHSLRANLFPGAPIQCHSLVQDSYTTEVNEKGKVIRDTLHHWHGRKTDDLAIWTQMLLERTAITKKLESIFRPPLTVRMPTRPRVPKEPPVQSPPPKANKRKSQTKTKKPQIVSVPMTQPSEDDNFWDFYEKPIF